MKQSNTLGLLLLLILTAAGSQAQDVSGFWLGVTYPADPNQAVYNYTMTITQNGSALGGTTETSNPNVPFGGLAYLSGQIVSNQVNFSEADKNGSTSVKGICFWRGKLTYNPTEESLIGTYENMTNSTCTIVGSGKVELYRIVLKSPTKYCKGSPISLIVTGKNIQWYSSPTRTNPIAKGNTFNPTITKTTTFYITQTLYKNESPAIPVTIEVIEPTFTAIPTNPGCGRTSGSIALTAATGATGWQYSLNGGAFQTSPIFPGLGPGTYNVKAKDAAGCQSEQSITLTSVSGPIISDLKATPPQCGTANGEVSVVASGGKAPLTYSIDYGSTFQTSPLFSKLAGGTYTFRVRDDNGCEFNKAIALPAANSMAVLSSTGLPTTCGQANGSVTMTTSGGNNPIQYSIDNQTYQTGNTFTGLQSGNYVLQARDGTGCAVSQTISVAASTGPQLARVQTMPAGCGQPNGAILITSANTVSTIDYSINGQAFQRTSNFSSLKAGSYVLVARDTNNCTVSQNIVVPFDCASTIHLPTAFSPNADHVNDALTIHFGFPSLTISRFTVYDRWGVVMYNRANFEVSTGDSIWDGQVNGQPAPKGIYVYRLDYQLPDGTQTSYRESVALLNE
ncbi:T9SS type B sorting domain-containing protein [Spirosoma validum]|uniref:Gliding motility-associated C-terminal domain-containing protein n=1 Tax=Spirosoma validum TaxID=2771355 RepID=A0A927GFH5_9BACT|nr:gliding motility-associated C-terminal domain-containing protein [Spirosoma validum]MBD2755932.1 gliding motility-associated C-terminal domain-containing protein [Spirosoma validum]